MHSSQKIERSQTIFLDQLPNEIICMIFEYVALHYIPDSTSHVVDVEDLESTTRGNDEDVNPFVPARACKLLYDAAIKAFYKTIVLHEEVCALAVTLSSGMRDSGRRMYERIYRDIQHTEIELTIGRRGFELDREIDWHWLKEVAKAIEDRVQMVSKLKSLHVHIALDDDSQYMWFAARPIPRPKKEQIEAGLKWHDRRVRRDIAHVVALIQDLEVERSMLSLSAYSKEQDLVDMKGEAKMDMGDADVLFRV